MMTGNSLVCWEVLVLVPLYFWYMCYLKSLMSHDTHKDVLFY